MSVVMVGVHHQSAMLLLLAAQRASARRDNNSIHRAADSCYPSMLIAISYAFAKGRKAVDKTLLKRATTDKQAMTAMDAVPGAVRAALMEVLPKAILKAVVAGGNAGFKLIPKKSRAARALAGPSIKMRFDATSDEAIEWATEHAGELAKDLSETTEADIRDAIVAALEGDGLDSAYDDILDAVGDEARAAMIARTEVMDAANEGLAQSWDQAIEEGLLTGKELKVWIATSGCCDECDEVDGEEVPLSGTFSVGDDPPLHPNCRCTMGISGATE